MTKAEPGYYVYNKEYILGPFRIKNSAIRASREYPGSKVFEKKGN